MLINILNPKLTIFFAFLPQVVSAGETQVTLRMLELAAVFMVVTFAVLRPVRRVRRPDGSPAPRSS